MKEWDTYKYLGIHENMSYVGPINKQNYKRILPPNKKRAIIIQSKIELSSFQIKRSYYHQNYHHSIK